MLWSSGLTLCSDVVGYQHFGGTFCLHPHPDDGGNMATVSQPR